MSSTGQWRLKQRGANWMDSSLSYSLPANAAQREALFQLKLRVDLATDTTGLLPLVFHRSDMANAALLPPAIARAVALASGAGAGSGGSDRRLRLLHLRDNASPAAALTFERSAFAARVRRDALGFAGEIRAAVQWAARYVSAVGRARDSSFVLSVPSELVPVLLTFGDPVLEAELAVADGTSTAAAVNAGVGTNMEALNVEALAAAIDGANIARSFPAPSSLPPGGHTTPATAGLAGTGTGRSGSPPRQAEDVSKLDLAIMACTMALLVPVALNIKDLSSSWDTRWKVLYGLLMMVSFVSTITGFLTAWCPAVSWARKFSPFCARFGLIVAAALFVVFVACKLGRFGCVAGVPSAAVVLLFLILVWMWSEQQSGRVEPDAEQGA
ncbi:hypothetical protein ACP4OV_011651 [Aristida adscensionis]